MRALEDNFIQHVAMNNTFYMCFETFVYLECKQTDIL